MQWHKQQLQRECPGCTSWGGEDHCGGQRLLDQLPAWRVDVINAHWKSYYRCIMAYSLYEHLDRHEDAVSKESCCIFCHPYTLFILRSRFSSQCADNTICALCRICIQMCESHWIGRAQEHDIKPWNSCSVHLRNNKCTVLYSNISEGVVWLMHWPHAYWNHAQCTCYVNPTSHARLHTDTKMSTQG